MSKALQSQKELLTREGTTTTDTIQDMGKTVCTIDGSHLTVQKILCSLNKESGKRIYKGAEKLGSTGKVLLTFYASMEGKYRELASDIIPTLKR